MGVSGIVGVLKRYSTRWGSHTELKDMTVVIDTTNTFYWYAKRNLLPMTSMDKYGTSMVKYGEFIRNLFKRLQERNVKPVVVFEGARRSDQQGGIVSKTAHLENSARGALRRLNAGKFYEIDNLPDLTINCVKEIVAELNLDSIQAESEVYPVLVDYAQQHNCIVLTPHSDFIFKDVAKGFIWLEELQLPVDGKKPLYCTVYKHSDMLRSFNLTSQHSGALSCLSILLRDDFAESYYGPINDVLNLQRAGNLQIGPNVRFARVKTRRLMHILENWPRDSLTSCDSVRNAIARQPQAGPHLTRDYDGLFDCYCQPKPFTSSDLAQAFASNSDQLNLVQALTRRESSAGFLSNATQTNYNRTGIEDTKTYRSTFSLQDRVKQYLLERLRASAGVNLFDRRRDQMDTRSLKALQEPQTRLDGQLLFGLFHFDEAKLAKVGSRLQQTLHLDDDHSKRLALILLLASYAIRLAPRETYNNNKDLQQVSSNNSGSLNSEQNQQASVASRYLQSETRVKFFTCILNSYVYLQARTNQGDQSQQDVPAETRVARAKVDELILLAPSIHVGSNEAYMTIKHLMEAFNSVLHAYKELNSLYDFPAPNILVNKYYDAVIIYKLMARFSNNVKGYLLQLNEELLHEL